MPIHIIPYEEQYLVQAITIWNEVVQEGVSFPQLDLLKEADGHTFFVEQNDTGLAIEQDTGRVVGLYILHPNNVGRCGHICNASYAVLSSFRGKGVGELLVKDCIVKARKKSYRILQFNAVVATNQAAIHLYRKLGFVQLGIIPGGFAMPDGSYEDIIPHILDLTNLQPMGDADNMAQLSALPVSDNVVPAESLEHTNHDKQTGSAIAYVDGSYNAATGEYSYGMVMLVDGQEITASSKGNDSELSSMHNVAGEIKGAEAAMQYALDHKIRNLTIYYDYEGIAKWCLGEWKTNKQGTKAYKAFYEQAKRHVSISFVKVKAHSADYYNDMADALAKQAIGMS